jgi:ABC-2 type transport system permease protein
MRRLSRLTLTLLRDWIRNREAVFFAMLFPIILLVIFSLAFGGGPTEFGVGVQNNDLTEEGEPTELSATFVDAVEQTGPLAVDQIPPGQNLSQVDNVEETTGYRRVLVVPDGFDERVRTGSARVRVAIIQDTVDQFGGNISEEQRAAIDAGLGAFDPGGAEGNGTGSATVTLLTTPDDEGAGAVGSILRSTVSTFNDRSIGVEEPPVAVRETQRGDESLGSTDYYLPAFIVAMILINGVMSLSSAVATLKRGGTLKRLAATPLRKHEWILANVIQQSVLAVLITGVMIAVAWLAFGVTVVPGPLAIGLVVLGAVAFSGLGMIVGSVITDPGSAVSLGGGIALPLMFVSGIFWELDLMPPTLQTVAEFSPVTHYHRSLRELLILDSTEGVAFTAGVLAVLAVVFLSTAVYLTNWRAFD